MADGTTSRAAGESLSIVAGDRSLVVEGIGPDKQLVVRGVDRLLVDESSGLVDRDSGQRVLCRFANSGLSHTWSNYHEGVGVAVRDDGPAGCST